MAQISGDSILPMPITIELAGLTINGLPPSGKVDQPCMLNIKAVRQQPPDEKSWTQCLSGELSYHHVLLINKGSEELVRTFLVLHPGKAGIANETARKI